MPILGVFLTVLGLVVGSFTAQAQPVTDEKEQALTEVFRLRRMVETNLGLALDRPNYFHGAKQGFASDQKVALASCFQLGQFTASFEFFSDVATQLTEKNVEFKARKLQPKLNELTAMTQSLLVDYCDMNNPPEQKLTIENDEEYRQRLEKVKRFFDITLSDDNIRRLLK